MRTLDQLLAELDRSGITLTVEGERLKVRGRADRLSAELRAELGQRKDDLIAVLSGKTIATPAPSAPPVATPEPPQTTFALTPNQKRLWFLDRLEGTGTEFTLLGAWLLEGELNLTMINNAINGVRQRHDILRAVINDTDDQPMFSIKPFQPVQIQAVPLGTTTIDNAVATEMALPFNLAGGDLFRVRLCQVKPQQQLLLLTIHHIIADRTSMAILYHELSVLAAAGTMATAQTSLAEPVQFEQYAEQQANQLTDQAMAQKLAYWQRQLQGAATGLELPIDLKRPNSRGFHGAFFRFDIPKNADLSIIAARHGVTPFMGFLGAYSLLIGRLTGQTEFTIGCPMSSRDQQGTANMVGFLVNTVTFRIDLSQATSFAALLRHIREVVASAVTNKDVPFDRVVDAINPKRQLNRGPLFQTTFVQHDAKVAPLTLPGLTVIPLPLPPMAPEVDISLAIERTNDPAQPLVGHFEYDAELFTEATATRIGAQFLALCQTLAAGNELHYSLLPIAVGEPSQWTGAPVDLADQSLMDNILQQLTAQPAATAIWLPNPLDETRSVANVITSADLAEQIHQLGDTLQTALSQASAPTTVIGISCHQRANLICGILTCLQQRQPFVIIANDAPAAYRDHIITSAGVNYLLSDSDTDSNNNDSHPLRLTAISSQNSQPHQPQNPALFDQEIAYICFTSGSTGTPKGVAVPQKAILNHAMAIRDTFGLTPSDRVLQFTAPTFDVIFEELLPTLLAGASVVIPDSAAMQDFALFNQAIDVNGITVVNIPAPFWQSWTDYLVAEQLSPPPSLRLVVTGSDRVSLKTLDKWRVMAANVRLLSGYGPTEATITSSFYQPDQGQTMPSASAPSLSAPLGTPLANVQLTLVDPNGEIVPTGVVGEIVIEGVAVAAGYINQAQPLADSPHSSPFRPRTATSQQPAYWTGDLGRRSATGELEFLGRKDNQIKVRGVRVDITGVEVILASFPQVSQAAVIITGDSPEQARLQAFVSGSVNISDLTVWLRSQLPSQHIPATISHIDQMPTLSSGKIDRRALAGAAQAALAAVDSATSDAENPNTTQSNILPDEKQQRISQAFSTVLNRHNLHPNSNFFDVGGDSISSLQIVAQARRLGLVITAKMIFEHQTIAGIAAVATAIKATTRRHGSGKIKATPILNFFKQTAGPAWRQFNQAVMLKVPPTINDQVLLAALNALIKCHEALRITVIEHPDSVEYFIPNQLTPNNQASLTVLDLSGMSAEQGQAAKAQAYAVAQQTLDPTIGHNINGVLIPTEGRFMLTIHHLAVDVLSWAPLLEDLESAYLAIEAGRPSDIQAIGTSFVEWSEKLQQITQDLLANPFTNPSTTPSTTPSRWSHLDQPYDRLLAAAGENPGLESSIARIQRQLSIQTTTDVLKHCRAAFGVRPDETIIAGLLKVMQAQGGTQLRVDVERNGRASFINDTDLSRTVGWFTNLIPVQVSALSPAADGATLDATKKTIPMLLDTVRKHLADLPLEGMGYGLQRYLGPANNPLNNQGFGEILLNYVGVLTGWNTADFRPVDEPCGPVISPLVQRTHLLELNVGVIENQMRLELSYSTDANCQAEAEQLIAAICQAIEEIGALARTTRLGLSANAHSISDILPVTSVQKSIYLHNLRNQETFFDLIHLQLEGPLDKTAYQTAWQHVCQRHKGLRATFRIEDGEQPVQLIHHELDPGWTNLDFSQQDPTSQQHNLAILKAADRAAGFDIENGPLLRFFLVQLSAQSHALIWSCHHLIMDGWSVSVALEESLALYQALLHNQPSPLQPAPDLAELIQHLASPDLAASQAYWAHTLADLEPCSLAPSLAVFQDTAPNSANQAKTVGLTIDPVLTGQLSQLAQAARVTRGTLIQAAWGLLIARYADIDEATFALTDAGRPADLEGSEHLIGMLINTFAVRVKIPAAQPLLGWLGQLQLAALERQPHQFLALGETLAAAGLGGQKLAFDSIVLIQNYPKPDSISTDALKISVAEVAEATDFALTLVVEWGRGDSAQPTLSILRDPQLVSHTASEQLLTQLHSLLISMVADPQQDIANLALYQGEALQQRLALGQGQPLFVPKTSIPELIRQWQEIIPHAPAVADHQQQLNYRQLNEKISQLANQLRSAGVQPGDRVVLALPRSVDMVAGFVAILTVAATVVPLDLNYPLERLRYILSDCAPSLILTNQQHHSQIMVANATDAQQPAAGQILLIDGPAAADQPQSDPVSEAFIDPQSAAYLIYTSGSTGQPKGVLCRHSGLQSLIQVQKSTFNLGPGDRILQFASPSFDACVWEIFMALGVGGQLMIPDREKAAIGADFAHYLRDEKITAATIPPSLLAVTPAESYPHLAILVVAGEACPPALAKRWAVGRRFFNAYGPSETTICATIFAGGGDGQSIPIGKAIPNVDSHVVDRAGRLVPVGCQGELVIGGQGLAIGYLNRPALTAKAFVNNPFADSLSTDNPARMYRTGDRVQLTRDGTLLFKGRIDRQIKLRGFRIEPGEIEGLLNAQANISRGLVNVVNASNGEGRLTAWLVPATGETIDIDTLRQVLSAALPQHMVPKNLILISEVPLTPNGKIDWDQLPHESAVDDHSGHHARHSAEHLPEHLSEHLPEHLPEQATPPAAVGLSLEQRLQNQLQLLWSQLVDKANIGINDDFFDIGGDSLLMVKLQAEMAEQFGVMLSTTDLLTHATIAQISALLIANGALLAGDDESDSAVASAAEKTQDQQTSAPALTASQASRESADIAIIGMAGRFGSNDDLGAFWQMLVDGKEGLTPIDTARHQIPLTNASGQPFVPVCGDINQPEYFDAPLFGMGARDAMIMDPQTRVFLETTWHALENAGYWSSEQPLNCGVFAGSAMNTWLQQVLIPSGERFDGSSGYLLATANEKDFLATHVAYRLNLDGPAMAVQSACSTSLTAVSMAVDAIRVGRCAMALAGGVAITFPQQRGYYYEKDMILAKDGHCRSFSEQAGGTVPSAGVGVVVLKKLAQASADGDNILAIIRGIGINNDGANKMAYSAPSPEGQANAIRRAMAEAGLTNNDIDYVETHGTATSLGDPIEILALTQSLGGRQQPLLIGSVKSNIGHADTASGVAGLIKTVQALNHGQIPASLHALPLNPRINFAAGPFEVVTANRAWPQHNRPNRAGISAFGIGGTNVHLIIEAASGVNDDPRTAEPTHLKAQGHPELLLLSANTETALNQKTADLAAYLTANPTTHLADVAFTLRVGRAALPYRRAIVSTSVATIAHDLQHANHPPAIHPAGHSANRLALLLPGQGSQFVAMGESLYHNNSIFRQHLTELSQQLTPLLGLSLIDCLYGDNLSGDNLTGDNRLSAELLANTQLTQPAIFCLTVAVARTWQALGINPEALLGHSVGEIAAAHLAGVFSISDALALIVERGKIVASMPAGAMLAVNLTEPQCLELIAEWAAQSQDSQAAVSLAAVNGVKQCVLSGTFAAIAQIEQRLLDQQQLCRRLQTSHAFHSPMMAPAVAAFEPFVRTLTLRKPTLGFVSNVTGSWITDQQATDPAYWAKHLLAPVRFAQGLSCLSDLGIDVVLECGPGNTLAKLAAGQGMTVLHSIDPPTPSTHTNSSDQPPSRLLDTIGQLWCRGFAINWTPLNVAKARRISLPLYPFERKPYAPETFGSRPMQETTTAQGPIPAKIPVQHQADPTQRSTISGEIRFYQPHWLVASPAETQPLEGPVFILADQQGISQQLSTQLHDLGISHYVLTEQASAEDFNNSLDQSKQRTICYTNQQHWLDLINSVGEKPRHIIDLSGLTAKDSIPPTSSLTTSNPNRPFEVVFNLANMIASQLSTHPITITRVTCAALAVIGDEPVDPAQGAAIGGLRILPFELPNLTVRHLDLAQLSTAAAQIITEIQTQSSADVVAIRDNQRWVSTVQQVAIPDPEQWSGARQGIVIITGGFGGVGSALARDLATEPDIHLILLSRQASAKVQDQPGNRQLIRDLRKAGAKVTVMAVDLADQYGVEQMVCNIRATIGPITGVIHAAGLADLGGVTQRRQWQDIETILQPKIAGTQHLELALAEQPIEFFVLCSSLGSFLPAAKFGQIAYAAANEYLDLCVYGISQRRGWKTVAINWDDWIEAGMTVAALNRQGLPPLAADEGLSNQQGAMAMRQILASQYQRLAVTCHDLPALISQRGYQLVAHPSGQSAAVAKLKTDPTPAAANDIISQVLDSFRTILNVPDALETDNFFGLGGHSLLAMQLLEWTRNSYGIELAIGDIFAAPTPRELTQLIKQKQLAVPTSSNPQTNKLKKEVTQP